MYAPIPNGSTEKVYDFLCHLPPVGYGVREVRNADKSHSYVVEKTEVIKRHRDPEKQYYERTTLPEDWEEKVMEEREQADKLNDLEYTDQVLDKFRQQEWNRRLKGVWFYNNGVPTYITGLHYFYLNWWHIDGGYPRYRDVDRRVFYALQFCIEDPDSLGMLEFTSRRSGKTYRSGAWMYEYVSRNKQIIGAIQSKNDEDAKDMYIKSIMEPWTELPEFFRPVYDTNKSDRPESGMFFNPTSKRGKNIQTFSVDNKKALKSQIKYYVAKANAVDSRAVHRYISDESGKLKDVDINERHGIVGPCCREGGIYIGKMYYTTTVEDIDKGGAKFRLLVEKSNYKDKNELGQTESGLYAIFTPASEYEGKFDVYGFTDVKANEARIRIHVESQKNQSAKYAAMRQYPLSKEWALRFTGEGDSLFDADAINTQIDALELADKMIEKGNLVWKDGIPYSDVEWLPSKQGKWTRCWKFHENGPEPNRVEKRGSRFYPLNKLEFVIGCDPFSHGTVQDEDKQSLAGAFVKMRYNPWSNDPMNGAFVMMYHARPQTTSIFHEDMVKTCHYFGCQVLFENNKNNWEDYFKTNGYEPFLMKLDQYEGYGCPGVDKNIEAGIDLAEELIASDIKKVFFRQLLNQWLGFEFKKRTKYDLAMASFYTLIADQRNRIRSQKTAGRTPTRVESFIGKGILESY